MAQPSTSSFCSNYQYYYLALQKLHAEGHTDQDPQVIAVNRKFSLLFVEATDGDLEEFSRSPCAFPGVYADDLHEAELKLRFLKRLREIHRELLVTHQTRVLELAA